jgi:hypothetical protein
MRRVARDCRGEGSRALFQEQGVRCKSIRAKRLWAIPHPAAHPLRKEAVKITLYSLGAASILSCKIERNPNRLVKESFDQPLEHTGAMTPDGGIIKSAVLSGLSVKSVATS